MNPIQWHMLFNHFPVIGFVVIWLFSLALLKNENFEMKKIYFRLLFICSFIGILAYQTGEAAEHFLKEEPAALEAHEDFAKISMLFCILLTVISTLGLLAEKYLGDFKTLIFRLSWILLTLALFVNGWTAHLGGLIRHQL